MSAYDPPQCQECVKSWIKLGRPADKYLIVSRGDHILDHNPDKSKTSPANDKKGGSASQPASLSSSSAAAAAENQKKPQHIENGARPSGTSGESSGDHIRDHPKKSMPSSANDDKGRSVAPPASSPGCIQTASSSNSGESSGTQA